MSDLALYLTAFGILMLAVGGLALGLIHNKPLKGSCGGIAGVTGESCNVCGASADDVCRDPAQQRN